LTEVFRYGGKGERRKKENEGKRELHQEKATEIRENGEAGVVQEEKLTLKSGTQMMTTMESSLETRRCHQPNVRFRDPPLTIADESFTLNDSKDEKDPRKCKEERDVTARNEKDKRRD
jgi:hypothetical protein